jgi:hypothetical protein
MVTRKYLSGGEIKGPASRPASNSLLNFESTALGLSKADRKLRASNDHSNKKTNKKPNIKLSTRCGS